MYQIEFLKTTALFSDLEDEALLSIGQHLVVRKFAQGDIIFREGDPGQILYLVYSGQVRIFINGLTGTETSVILFGQPGDIFGELAVIDGLPRSATAVAMEDTVLYTIERETFRDHMRHCPQLALNFMKVLTRRVRHNTQQIDTLATLPVPQRLAQKLVELAQDYGLVETNGVLINTSLTQGQIASLIGATRESTNKSLRDFRKREWIEIQNGQITILDPDALKTQVSL